MKHDILRRPPALSSLISIVAIGTVLLLIALELHHGYQRETETAGFVTQSIARTLEQQLHASLSRIDLVEQEAAQQYAFYRQGKVPASSMTPMLERHLKRIPGLLSLRLIDEKGDYVFDATGSPAAVNVADRRYFRVQEASPDSGFFPEGPLFSRVVNKWTLTFSRGVRSDDGRFLGVVQASIVVDALSAAFAKVSPHPSDTITFLNGEGKMISRYPEQAEVIGTNNISDKLRTAIAENNEEISYTATSNVDGRDRFYTLRRIDNYPFFILVGMDKQQVMQSWQRMAMLYALISLALLVTLAVIILRLSRQSRLFARRADEQLRLNTEVFASALEGIIVTDSDCRILNANRAICDITGYSVSELEGETPSLFKSGLHDRKFYQTFWSKLASSGRWQGEIHNKRKDGTVFPCRLSVSVIQDDKGKPLRYIGTLSDISEQKAAQQRLQFTNAELTRLTEIMAHHLQEPARRLVTFSHALKRALGGRAEEEDVAMPLQFIEQQALRLRALIRDIQLYLVVDQPLSSVESLPLTPIVERIANRRGEALSEIAAEVEIQPSMPPIQMDERRLSDMLDILLDNAIRYRRLDRQLKLKISAEMSGRRVVLRFADNGRGIEPEYRELVFQLFERLYAQAGDEGTGIGLSIVRRIVEQSGGKVRIEETRGGGATVVLDLPLGESELNSPEI